MPIKQYRIVHRLLIHLLYITWHLLPKITKLNSFLTHFLFCDKIYDLLCSFVMPTKQCRTVHKPPIHSYMSHDTTIPPPSMGYCCLNDKSSCYIFLLWRFYICIYPSISYALSYPSHPSRPILSLRHHLKPQHLYPTVSDIHNLSFQHKNSLVKVK